MPMLAYNVYLVDFRDIAPGVDPAYPLGGTIGTKQLVDTMFHTDKNAVAVKRQAVARGDYPANAYFQRRPRRHDR